MDNQIKSKSIAGRYSNHHPKQRQETKQSNTRAKNARKTFSGVREINESGETIDSMIPGVMVTIFTKNISLIDYRDIQSLQIVTATEYLFNVLIHYSEMLTEELKYFNFFIRRDVLEREVASMNLVRSLYNLNELKLSTL